MEGSIIRFRNVAAAAVIRDGGNEKETLGRLSEPGFSQDQDWRQNQVLRIKKISISPICISVSFYCAECCARLPLLLTLLT